MNEIGKLGKFSGCYEEVCHTHKYGTSTRRLNSSSWLLKPLYSGLIVLKRRPILSYWPRCGLGSSDSFIRRIYWCQQWVGTPASWFNIKMTSYQYSLIARFMGPTWAHLGPTGPRWAPCWPHELCYLCRKSHCGDKTVVRSSYLHNGISYICKMSSLYWIRALWGPISI